MNELRLKYPVRMMRRIMNVSASGYYAWVDRPLSKRAQEEVRLELEIMAAHQRNRQTYGPERLQRDLAEHGVRVGVCRIKRIRQKLGIRCKQKRRFKTTTNSAHRLPVADNLLGQQFKVSQPNAVWVSDITYIPTDEGWLYLAGHKDLFTGELVGYAMGERMTRNLVSSSTRPPEPTSDARAVTEPRSSRTGVGGATTEPSLPDRVLSDRLVNASTAPATRKAMRTTVVSNLPIRREPCCCVPFLFTRFPPPGRTSIQGYRVPASR